MMINDDISIRAPNIPNAPSFVETLDLLVNETFFAHEQ